MTLPRDEALERLDLAIRSADSGIEVEAVYRGQDAQLLRLGDGRITQAQHIAEGRIILRAIVRGAEAYASTTDLSREGLATCARMACERAAALPPKADGPGLPEPSTSLPATATASWDEPTAHLAPAEKAEWLAPALAAHEKDGLALAGRFHTGVRSLGVRSTRGVTAWHSGTYCDLAFSTLERPAGHRASSFRSHYDRAARQETLDALTQTTRDECHRAHDPQDVEPGRMDVVLSPTAVADLLEWFSHIAFSTEAFDDERSFVQGRFGQRITGEAITLRDDGGMSHGLGVPLPIDAEGMSRQNVLLIDQGVARASVFDHKGAHQHGCAATGHAQGIDLFSNGGAGVQHLHLEAGTSTLDELIGRVDRGLFITRFHYVNGLIEPKRAVMTGLLRDAAFLIEGGRLSRAVRPMRFTDAILEAFARVPGPGGLGSVLEPHGGINAEGKCTVCPAMLIPQFAFTSGR